MIVNAGAFTLILTKPIVSLILTTKQPSITSSVITKQAIFTRIPPLGE